ncbi:MAG TPA: 3-dehydroquinate dehydratase [Candidatus Stercoripulliclostridium merdipullorum]|uniref:3-dehydroquinate dehydratase n=1 Tax=Candidatus Stercoripulliclostridium merdipullorum TaxID=2840952 RepID=A0A9D1SXH9_9FIRM|nr:3-dehydroquinate dehydratase [Candidatus Stercoripulliclostridium merdipullorum]
MKILCLHGPNLNLLGIREPDLYGDRSYRALIAFVRRVAAEQGVSIRCKQTNHEGKLVDWIQKARGRYDGIVINAGAYTHTSVAVLDALKAVGIPTAEVHLTDIDSREDFRKHSYISLYAAVRVAGEGFEGYRRALTELVALCRNS